MELDIWRLELLRNGLHDVSISGSITLRTGLLCDFHGVCTDRMIVATALVTADRNILRLEQASASN